MSFFDQGPLGQGTVSAITRQDPQTGRMQISVVDPDRPTRWLWVDAVWNPVTYQWEPIDSRYKPGATYPARRWGNSFADSGDGMDFSGTLDVGLLPATASNAAGTIPVPSFARSGGNTDNSGILLLAVGVVVAVYLFSS